MHTRNLGRSLTGNSFLIAVFCGVTLAAGTTRAAARTTRHTAHPLEHTNIWIQTIPYATCRLHSHSDLAL